MTSYLNRPLIKGSNSSVSTIEELVNELDYMVRDSNRVFVKSLPIQNHRMKKTLFNLVNLLDLELSNGRAEDRVINALSKTLELIESNLYLSIAYMNLLPRNGSLPYKIEEKLQNISSDSSLKEFAECFFNEYDRDDIKKTFCRVTDDISRYVREMIDGDECYYNNQFRQNERYFDIRYIIDKMNIDDTVNILLILLSMMKVSYNKSEFMNKLSHSLNDMLYEYLYGGYIVNVNAYNGYLVNDLSKSLVSLILDFLYNLYVNEESDSIRIVTKIDETMSKMISQINQKDITSLENSGERLISEDSDGYLMVAKLVLIELLSELFNILMKGFSLTASEIVRSYDNIENMFRFTGDVLEYFKIFMFAYTK